MDKKNVGHTKGPWKQGGRHGHNAGTIYAVDKDDAIACVYGIPMHTKVDEVGGRYAEGMANARLIAAAPALLEALERSHACLQSLAEIHIGERAISNRIDERLKQNVTALARSRA